jgi:hypothetical protein
MSRKLTELRREVEKLKQAASSNSITLTMKDGGQVTLTAKQLQSEDENDLLFVSWVYAYSDPEIPASDGSRLHALAQMVGPVVETEAEFDALPWFQQDSVASSFGTDRNVWPDWLRERYKHKPDEAFYNYSKHWEDWPQFKARMELLNV